MNNGLLALVFGCTMALGGASQAATLFSENFSDEATSNGSVLNFTGFNEFTVTSGTVDLIQNGGYGISCETVGCVDLDGSTSNSGLLSSTVLSFVAGVQYTFSTTMSGNQRGGADDSVSFGITNGVLSQLASFNPFDGFTTLTYIFTVASDTTGSVFFQDHGTDNRGVILDRVSVTSNVTPPTVPIPASLPLLLAGLGGIGLMRRRRKSS